MKKIALLTLFLTATFSFTFGQVKMPPLSPQQTLTTEFALSKIDLTYGRPSLRGRQMIGDIVPWDVVWRAGANDATVITFGDTVNILGNKINPGPYALYIIPHANGIWDFILNEDTENFGVDGYQAKDNILNQPIVANSLSSKVETLTMQFSNMTSESCILDIQWENFELKIPIQSKIKDRLRTAIEANLETDPNSYFQAARFYDEYDHNKAKALSVLDQGIKKTGNQKYWEVFYKAKLQLALGDKADAIATAKQSRALAEKANSENYRILTKTFLDELE